MEHSPFNILITGVGGQGTVLASKILAKTAARRGYFVRQAETIGMAQRGGTVASHVRIAEDASLLDSPLLPKDSADIVIGFEPNETLRALPYYGPEVTIVSAADQEIPPSAGRDNDDPTTSLIELKQNAAISHLVLVDNNKVYERLGSAKPLNVTLLGVLLGLKVLPFREKELIDVIQTMVKPQFIEMNLQALSYGVDLAA